MSDIHIHFRVAIVGGQRQKVAKVFSLIAAQPTLQDGEDEPEQRHLHVEYIPCVASFDSYQNENGQDVKYLEKLEYHGEQGESRGTSLAPFFDEVMDNNDVNVIRIPGIAAVAIGCGIESEEDISMISSFMNLLSGNNDVNEDDIIVLIQCIQPNGEYSSMKEETMAYKNLSPEEKEQATESQTIGPGKMAKFAIELAKQRIPRSKKATAITNKTDKHTHTDESANEANLVENEKEEEPLPPPMPKEYDPNTTRFACKMCRTVLFNESDLEDPPHTKSQHSFSTRKMKYGANMNFAENRCQSAFLADGLDWMGDIRLSHEGKLSCPKCSGKLGLYKWHGTQCSCGTWVVPAIMVHKSRVDILPPQNERQQDPLALLMSPLAGLHVAGQM